MNILKKLIFSTGYLLFNCLQNMSAGCEVSNPIVEKSLSILSCPGAVRILNEYHKA